MNKTIDMTCVSGAIGKSSVRWITSPGEDRGADAKDVVRTTWERLPELRDNPARIIRGNAQEVRTTQDIHVSVQNSGTTLDGLPFIAFLTTGNDRLSRQAMVISRKESQGVHQSLQPTFEVLSKVRTLDRQRRTQTALCTLFEEVDKLLFEERFGEVDRMIRQIRPSTFSTTVLLGFLNATQFAKSRLPSRPELVRQIRQLLVDRDESEEGILTGLE